MESIEEAPLEQNEKNLECDGFPYKVVQEEHKPHEVNKNPINASRKAFIRALKRHLGHKKTRKNQHEEECHALRACTNAAVEEISAEERQVRKDMAEMEFHSKIKNAVNKRCQLDEALNR